MRNTPHDESRSTLHKLATSYADHARSRLHSESHNNPRGTSKVDDMQSKSSRRVAIVGMESPSRKLLRNFSNMCLALQHWRHRAPRMPISLVLLSFWDHIQPQFVETLLPANCQMFWMWFCEFRRKMLKGQKKNFSLTTRWLFLSWLFWPSDLISLSLFWLSGNVPTKINIINCIF